MKSFFFGLCLLTSFAALAATIKTYNCDLKAGSGPFKTFKLEMRTDTLGRSRALHLDVVYTPESGRVFDEETITDLSVRTLRELSNLTHQIIKIRNVGDWGNGEIDMGTDESGATTALITFLSDSTSNRGVYGCEVQ